VRPGERRSWRCSSRLGTAVHPDAQRREIISIEVDQRDPTTGYVEELWTVQYDGGPKTAWRMKLTRDPQGGTYYTVESDGSP